MLPSAYVPIWAFALQWRLESGADVLEPSARLSHDESHALSLTLPTALVPEPQGLVITFDHDRLKASRSCYSEPSYGGLDELTSETTTAMIRCDSQPIDRPPPAVPAGNDRSHEVIASLGDQKSVGIEGNQLLETRKVIRVGRFRLGDLPQSEHSIKIAGPPRADRHLHLRIVGQAHDRVRADLCSVASAKLVTMYRF